VEQRSNRQILSYLDQLGRDFKRQAPLVYRTPTKNRVHKLRVTSRRFRVALWFAKKSESSKHLKKLFLSMKKLGKALGEVRELDIAIQDAAFFYLKSEDLKSLRLKAKKNLQLKINPKIQKKILRQIKNVFQLLERNQEIDLTPGINKLTEKLDYWGNKTAILEKNIHQVRIDIKKARYTLEILGKDTRPLKRVQDGLGKIHDLEVLQTLLDKNPIVQNQMNEQFKKIKSTIQPTLNNVTNLLEKNL
jgi:CHAD domain-containing protein